MTALRSAASALLILGLTLSAFFVVPPTPANAEESGAGLSATVFAFDFSGSIFCYDGGKPNPSCKNPINESLSEAVNSLAAEISTNASKYAARKIDFNVTRFGSASKGSVSVCKGNTATQVDLLVSCLRNVAQLYLKPSSELGGTAFSPEIQVLSDYAGQRCGLILFTDGTPDDKDKALALANSSSCAILPVSTGPGDINQEYLQKITSTELDTIPGCTDRQFSWTTVYFESAAAATQAIGTALDEVACLLRIPGPDCMAVSQYQTTLENLGLQVVLGTGVGTSQFPSVSGIAPIPGTRVDKGSTVTLGTGTDAAPAQCTPIQPPPLACVADGPLSWLGCNPWWLLLLLGLVVARLLWIRREIEVSVNGKAAVGLGNGPWNGFDVYSGDARMNLNPRAESIQIHRSFVRSARFEDCRTAKTLGTKMSLRMDEEVTLQDGLKFVAGYGSGGRSASNGGRVSQGSSTSRKASDESTSSAPKDYEW
jgi:hypothetical protein